MVTIMVLLYETGSQFLIESATGTDLQRFCWQLWKLSWKHCQLFYIYKGFILHIWQDAPVIICLISDHQYYLWINGIVFIDFTYVLVRYGYLLDLIFSLTHQLWQVVWDNHPDCNAVHHAWAVIVYLPCSVLRMKLSQGCSKLGVAKILWESESRHDAVIWNSYRVY